MKNSVVGLAISIVKAIYATIMTMIATIIVAFIALPLLVWVGVTELIDHINNCYGEDQGSGGDDC